MYCMVISHCPVTELCGNSKCSEPKWLTKDCMVMRKCPVPELYLVTVRGVYKRVDSGLYGDMNFSVAQYTH